MKPSKPICLIPLNKALFKYLNRIEHYINAQKTNGSILVGIWILSNKKEI